MTRIKEKLRPKNLKPEIQAGRAILPGVYDKCFKKVMIEARPFLIAILHEILKLPIDYLEEHLEIKNPEYSALRLKEKKGQSDILVEVLNHSIILEMNFSYDAGTVEKSISYFSRRLLNGITVGTPYGSDRVNILIDFALEKPSYFPDTDEVVNRFRILEEKYYFPLTENVQFYFVNLAKVYDKWYNGEKLDELEKKLLLFVITDKEDLSNISKGSIIMEEAREKLESLNSKELFTEYEMEAIDAYANEVSLRHARQEGREEGREEEKLEMAKSLLKQGILPIEKIAEALNLPIEEVEKLKTKN